MGTGPLKKNLSSAALYQTDFNRWSSEQGRALRGKRLADVDWENVAEEIESLGRSDKRSLESNLNVVLFHLLKWRYQPDQRKPGWRSSIIEHRARIRKLIDESPSLRSYPAEVLNDEYSIARLKAVDETGVPGDRFPRSCPFTIEQALDLEYYPAEQK